MVLTRDGHNCARVYPLLGFSESVETLLRCSREAMCLQPCFKTASEDQKRRQFTFFLHYARVQTLVPGLDLIW